MLTPSSILYEKVVSAEVRDVVNGLMMFWIDLKLLKTDI